MNLKENLEKDLLDAMRAKDDVRRNVIRLILTNVKLQEVENREPLSDDAILAIIQKEIKTRKEVIEESQNAGRSDLVGVAQKDILILKNYLPSPLSEIELTELIKTCILEIGAKSTKDMGKVIKEVIVRSEGRASNDEISRKVRALLM